METPRETDSSEEEVTSMKKKIQNSSKANVGIMKDSTIVVAGATGNLGGRIARALIERGAIVRALVRHGSAPDKIERLKQLGVAIASVDLSSVSEVTPACLGASCVVSALNGLRDVIVEGQTVLLEAAIKADVPRFIPSDYSIDFIKFPPGENRNLDLRRDFHKPLDKSSISATTIFNGAFAELLTGQMPLILFKLKRVLFWGDADQHMDFTTIDDTAAFTASAALDPSTPRFLRIAGDQVSARELTAVVSEVTGKKFRLLRAGGLGMLGTLIKVARTVAPGGAELYPAWQGMQYMRNMLDGRAKLQPLDNERYPSIRWTTARDVLAAHPARGS
jgi:nucleoside-diphosphate-sugar epimerase